MAKQKTRLRFRAPTPAAPAAKRLRVRVKKPSTKSVSTKMDLIKPWSVDVTLLAPDPTGYQALILDESGVPVARSIRERAPMDFEDRRFNFIFVPPVTLDYGKHRYRLAIAGPSGLYVPFEGWAPRRVDTGQIKINCLKCRGTHWSENKRCPECAQDRSDDPIPF